VVFPGRLVVSRSIRVAGDEMDEALFSMRQKYNLLIGQRMAERAKITRARLIPCPRNRLSPARSKPGHRFARGGEVSSVGDAREALRDCVHISVRGHGTQFFGRDASELIAA